MINLVGYEDGVMGGVVKFTIPFEVGTDFQKKYWSREIVDENNKIIHEIRMADIMLNDYWEEKDKLDQQEDDSEISWQMLEAFNNAKKR